MGVFKKRKPCEQCGKEIKRGQTRFCSRQCYRDYVKGDTFNEIAYERKAREQLTDRIVKRNIYLRSKGSITYDQMTPKMIGVQRAKILEFRKRKEEIKAKPVKSLNRECAICGNSFISDQPKAKYCSHECTLEKARRSQKSTRKYKLKQKKYCTICGAEYQSSRERSQYCSYACRHKSESITKKIQNRLREKRLYDNSTVIEKVTIEYLFLRDHGTCQICKKKVNLKLKHPHPLSPSMDHIIPISKGGEHIKQNLRLAHFICNSKRSDHYDHDQLLLFG